MPQRSAPGDSPPMAGRDAVETLGAEVTALTPLSRVRLEPKTSDRVYAALVVAIRNLDLPPGQRLSETELARQLGVSRTPVREAIARLVDGELLQVLPQVGTLVARIRMADVHEAGFVRESLEVACVTIVCEQPDRDVSGLRACIEDQEAAHAEHDLDAFFRADEAMHMEIFRLAGHPGAWQAVQRMKLQLDRIRRLSLPEPSTIRELIDEHDAIVDAIEAADVDHGVALVRNHARRALRQAPALQAKHPDYFDQ